MTDDEILNIEQASEFLKIKKSTLYQKKKSNEIPFHKIGGKVVFMKSELIAYVKSK